ncbi:MAG: type II toxin-antitoxin system VapC family toxin, partial [Actinomycetota bacterium]|nr:type II toxin-antitoxin system VapC family toxin [Actinomycetota bacterium]
AIHRGNGQSIRQIWWPPSRSSRGRQRSALWPSPFRFSWPLTDAWLLRHNMTVTDALYVVVAKHLGADLVTTDLKLANSPTLPVSTVTP